MQTLLSGLVIILYLIAATLIFVRLKKRAAGGESGRFALLAAWAGALLLHIIILYQQLITPTGLNLAFFNALSTVAVIVAALILLSTINRPVENLGLVLLPIAALCVGAAQIAGDGSQPPLPSADHIQIHVFVSLLAYSLLTIAAVQALLLSVQDRYLHSHRPGGLIRALPPLQWMEELLFRVISLGLILLGIALITGFIFLEDLFAQHLVHKTVLSIVAWLVFAILLFGRRQFGWRGQTAIRWTLGGFFVLMLAYFGSKAVLELVLHRT